MPRLRRVCSSIVDDQFDDCQIGKTAVSWVSRATMHAHIQKLEQRSPPQKVLRAVTVSTPQPTYKPAATFNTEWYWNVPCYYDSHWYSAKDLGLLTKEVGTLEVFWVAGRSLLHVGCEKQCVKGMNWSHFCSFLSCASDFYCKRNM